MSDVTQPPKIGRLPEAPNRQSARPDFVVKADAFVAAQDPWGQQVNVLADWMEGIGRLVMQYAQEGEQWNTATEIAKDKAEAAAVSADRSEKSAQKHLDDVEKLVQGFDPTGSGLPVVTKPDAPLVVATKNGGVRFSDRALNSGVNLRPAMRLDFANQGHLDPRVTFSRPSKAWGWRNGVLVEYGVDEPVFEDGGLRLEPQATNYVANSEDLTTWTPNNISLTLRHDPQFGAVYKLQDTIDEDPVEHFLEGRLGVHLERGAPSTYSVLIAPYNTRYIQLSVYHVFSVATGWVQFDSVTGDVTGTSGMVKSYKIDRIDSNWLLLTLSMVKGSGGPYSRFSVGFADGFGDPNYGFYTGDGSKFFEVRAPMALFEEDAGLYPALTSYIPTHGSPETRAADQLQWTGASFDRAFNPSRGAFIFKIGEKSGLPNFWSTRPYYVTALWTETGNITTPSSGGIYFSSSGSGRLSGVSVKTPDEERHSNAISHNIHPGDTVGLSWQGETISLFVNGTLAGSFTHPDVVGALQAVKRFHIPDGQHMYLERMSMFTTRPTDAEMEALTNA